MELKRLVIKNIRSYKEEEIIFPKGSTLLAGDIGSGKTSILLAIEYALFGLQPGQRGSALLTNGKEQGNVLLECIINDKEIIIERGLRRGNKAINQDYASIVIEGEKIESSVTEIKTKVLELLNYPSEFIKKNNLLYRYTVYTPQEEMKQIILGDAESRLNILRNIFGIEKYKRIKENLSILTVNLREEAKILEVEIRDLNLHKNKLDSSKKFLDLLNEKINIKKSDLDKSVTARRLIEKEVIDVEQKIREKENFIKEIEKANIVLANKKDQLIKEQKLIKELEDKLSQNKELYDEIKFKDTLEEIKNKQKILDALNKKFIEISGEISSINLKRREDLEKKNRIFKIDICPTCLQNVSENHKHNILNETENQLKKIEEELIKLKSELNKIIAQLEIEKSSLKNLENRKSEIEILKIKIEEVNEARERIVIYKRTEQNLINDIDFLKNHMQTLKEATLEFTKFDNMYKIKKEELKIALEKEKQTEIELAELKKEVEITEREITELKEKIKETEEIREKLIKILEIEKWLSNDFLNLMNFTEKNIMLAVRNEFSKLFNKWFSMLTTDALYVRLDENFTPIINQGDFELDYSYLSGGERTAIALAYRLALNQILNSLLSQIRTRGLVILDEPTDGFSDQQLDKVRDILQELNMKQLILVSHEQKIEGFVDNVIRLRKINGISRKE